MAPARSRTRARARPADRVGTRGRPCPIRTPRSMRRAGRQRRSIGYPRSLVCVGATKAPRRGYLKGCAVEAKAAVLTIEGLDGAFTHLNRSWNVPFTQKYW